MTATSPVQAPYSTSPVKVGTMLFTLVDPHHGHEVAYNRWYERDHFYAGCLVGPWLFAGRRWVATRPLKDLRFPADTPSEHAVADPLDAGSYLATYWIHEGKHAEHFEWANNEVFKLYEAGRGFDERTHAHTSLYTFRDVTYRDADPVPLELALDHGFGGLVAVFIDRAGEGDDLVSQDQLAAWLAGDGHDLLGADSPVAIGSMWRAIRPTKGAPMKLGTGPGGKERSMQLFFVDDDPSTCWDRFEAYGAALHEAGLGTIRLAAPFIPTVVGTDTYTDQLW